MADDYIPASDGNFNIWQTNFVTYVMANMVALGITTGQASTLEDFSETWTEKLNANTAAQMALTMAVNAKDQAKADLITTIRQLVNEIQTRPATTDTQRAALGITIRSDTRTPVPAPTTRPIATIDNSQRWRHIIAFMDEGTPTSKAKPAGVSGCQIWSKVGGLAPVAASDVHFLATDTRTPYLIEYDGTQTGQTVYYMLRWVNTRNEPGPWSVVFSAMIMG